MSINYDRLAHGYAPNRTAHAQTLERLAARCDPSPAATVLEAGCGSGNYSGALAARTGATCYGLDPSTRMLAEAAQRTQGVFLLQGRAEELPFARSAFDLVFSVDVIHHVTGRAEYLREAWRVLRPGGRLCTVTDSPWMIRHRHPLAEYFPGTVEPEMTRYPSPEDLRDWMEQAGFALEDDETVELRYDVIDLQPFRDKAFSSLYLIGEAEFQAGLARMERVLASGPIPAVWRSLLLWGRK